MKLCYWIIGENNKRQTPAFAYDRHDEDGELLGETRTLTMQSYTREEAHRLADRLKRRLHATAAHFDLHTTRDTAKA